MRIYSGVLELTVDLFCRHFVIKSAILFTALFLIVLETLKNFLRMRL